MDERYKDWITLREAAECHRVSFPALLKRVGDGDLPGVLWKGRWWVEPVALHAFLAATTEWADIL